jgi:hypothetical protein
MRAAWVGLGAAAVLSIVWMGAVPGYVYHHQMALAATYADSVAASCHESHADRTGNIDCRKMSAAAFDTALDPIVKTWPVGGPYLYAGVMLLLLWAIAGGIAFTIDWLRRGFGLYRSA